MISLQSFKLTVLTAHLTGNKWLVELTGLICVGLLIRSLWSLHSIASPGEPCPVDHEEMRRSKKLHITQAMSLQSLVKAQVKSYVGHKQDKNLACSTDDMRYFCTPCLFVTKLHISLAVIFQNGFCLFSKTCSPAPPHTPSWFRLMGEPGEWQEPQQLWILKM